MGRHGVLWNNLGLDLRKGRAINKKGRQEGRAGEIRSHEPNHLNS